MKRKGLLVPAGQKDMLAGVLLASFVHGTKQ